MRLRLAHERERVVSPGATSDPPRTMVTTSAAVASASASSRRPARACASLRSGAPAAAHHEPLPRRRAVDLGVLRRRSAFTIAAVSRAASVRARQLAQRSRCARTTSARAPGSSPSSSACSSPSAGCSRIAPPFFGAHSERANESLLRTREQRPHRCRSNADRRGDLTIRHVVRAHDEQRRVALGQASPAYPAPAPTPPPCTCAASAPGEGSAASAARISRVDDRRGVASDALRRDAHRARDSPPRRTATRPAHAAACRAVAQTPPARDPRPGRDRRAVRGDTRRGSDSGVRTAGECSSDPGCVATAWRCGGATYIRRRRASK